MTTRDALRLLQAEIVQVVGCTEPAAIAYALRTLVRHTQPPPPPETFPPELRTPVDPPPHLLKKFPFASNFLI